MTRRYMLTRRPPFVRRDHTHELLQAMRSATIDELPSLPDAAAGARMMSILHEAGLHLRASVAWYDQYVPVIVAVPLPYEASDPVVLATSRTPLTQPDVETARLLRDRFSPSAAGAAPAKAFRDNSEPLSFELAQVIAARLAMYWDIVLHSGTA